MTRAIRLGLAAAASAAALSAVAASPLETPVVVPPPGSCDPSGRVFFHHDRHAPYVPECGACHRYGDEEAIPGAEVRAPDFARPEEVDCLACHPFERLDPIDRGDGPDPEACGLCHPVDDRGRVALPAVLPRFRSLAFDHRRHERVSGAPCAACHDLRQIDSGNPPGMPTCLPCHPGALDGDCGRCHLHDGRGRLRTTLPRGKVLVPPAWMGTLAHVPGFDATHGPAARARRTVCARCHEDTFCQGCHLGTAAESRFHPAGWTSVHGPASRTSDLECETCHRAQDRCLGCHRLAGAAMDSPEIGRGVPRGASFHGPLWNADRTLHAREARRNLMSCVSCHAERDCLSCHQVGFDPHGRNFGSRCRRLAEVSPETCTRCHPVTPPCPSGGR